MILEFIGSALQPNTRGGMRMNNGKKYHNNKIEPLVLLLLAVAVLFLLFSGHWGNFPMAK